VDRPVDDGAAGGRLAGGWRAAEELRSGRATVIKVE
jgi:hypothetical protein